jgi:hypothetical protein
MKQIRDDARGEAVTAGKQREQLTEVIGKLEPKPQTTARDPK